MDIRDLFIKTAIVFCTFWAVDRLIISRFKADEPCVEEVRAGQTFSAPDKRQMLQPLNHEIDFIDARRTLAEQKTKINTTWAELVFSSEGAALERLRFARNVNGINVPIDTIFPAVEREDKAFLVALGQKTPYYFTLVQELEYEDTHEITYEANFGDGIMRKKFVVYKDVCKMDLVLDVVPRVGIEQPVQARIFFPSPLIPDLQNQYTQAIGQNAQGYLEKKAADAVNFNEYRALPELFGTENRYFVHAMIADNEHFATRGYYAKSHDEVKLVTIIEGPEINDAHSWRLSWYLGPKDIEAIVPVDERLEKVLDYSGMLAPLSKLLLKLLKWLYSYVHNYGFAILLLTLITKLFMLPFTFRGERSMKRDNGEMQRRMQYVQQKFKHDPERLRAEQAEIIRKYGMPQMLGCLPNLLQIPLFIALNRVLSNAIELYQAPFIGWITDLSSPDRYYVLPFLISGAMVVQALMGEGQQRTMMLIAALFIGAAATTFSTGLVLYIIASTVIGLVFTALTKYFKAA